MYAQAAVAWRRRRPHRRHRRSPSLSSCFSGANTALTRVNAGLEGGDYVWLVCVCEHKTCAGVQKIAEAKVSGISVISYYLFFLFAPCTAERPLLVMFYFCTLCVCVCVLFSLCTIIFCGRGRLFISISRCSRRGRRSGSLLITLRRVAETEAETRCSAECKCMRIFLIMHR